MYWSLGFLWLWDIYKVLIVLWFCFCYVQFIFSDYRNCCVNWGIFESKMNVINNYIWIIDLNLNGFE